jgi:PKD repeat protein
MSLSNYPSAFDNDANLFLVHDSLRVTLANDYNPGDTSITVNGDISNFPPVGVITLTEQCSDVDERAISFQYTSTTTSTFNGLTLLPNFPDVIKPKTITDVTQNVMADMHNALKDALIAIETFAGIKGQVALTPLTGTMEQRVNFLQNLVLKPIAWFNPSKFVGNIPLSITFTDLSIRSVDTWIWNFGDGNITTISGGTTGTTLHTYSTPGDYDVTLTVSNIYGSNSFTVPDLIDARTIAPNAVTLDWFPTAAQSFSGGVFHSRNNELISVQISSTGQQLFDPIISYTWNFGDDLTHLNSINANAMYGIGGLYDVNVRTDTTLGSYRVSVFPSIMNITESVNLWMFLFDPLASPTAITKNVSGYEFGLISETFKVGSRNTQSVTRDYNFLTGLTNQTQQVNEFRRNNGFAPRSLVDSGDRGTALLYWAEGADTTTDLQYIRFREYNGFDDVWITPVLGNGSDGILRTWNWFSFNAPSTIYFNQGLVGYPVTSGSPTNQDLDSVSLLDLSLSTVTFTSANYLNGADELMNNVGDGSDGDFSVYRTAWQNSNGYIVRNDGVGTYFRLKSFYQTEGILSTPIQYIRKLTDMPGNTKLEGQLVPLSNGVYFFTNSGEVVVYNPTTNTWATGGPGLNSNAFTALQDSSVAGFSDISQALVAASDGEHTAFLSYDYSTNAFIKFNDSDLTFTSLSQRPPGEQFMMGVF